MNVVEDYLLAVSNATKLRPKQSVEKLLLLLRLHPQLNPAIVKLNNLGNLDPKQISAAVDSRKFYNDDWLAFNQVVETFIKLSNQMNPWLALELFDLFSTYINDLSVAFTNKNHGYMLTQLLADTFDFVIPFATQLDFQLVVKEMHRKPRLTYLALILLKVFNNIRSQLGAGDNVEMAKKSIMLLVGVKLCLTYFKLDNPLLCRNVFSNMNNASLQFRSYPQNQQIQYRYYLAKFYLVKHQFADAYQHFSWCLENTPTNYRKDNANVSRILQELIPAAIVLGKIPNFSVIYQTFYTSAAQAPRFLSVYSQLLRIVKSGSFHDFQKFMAANYTLLKEHKLLLYINTKCPVLILRNLLKKVHVLQGSSTRLEYDSTAIALSTSLQGIPLSSVVHLTYEAEKNGSVKNFQNFGNPSAIDDSVVENCLITLIDQNLLKGKLFPRLRVCSLSKTNAFPPVASINFVKFGNGAEGRLSHSDKWMS